jgi:hypothetical protein
MPFVIIEGTVRGPDKVVGPFATQTDAEDFASAQDDEHYTSWHVLELLAPEDEDSSWKGE